MALWSRARTSDRRRATVAIVVLLAAACSTDDGPATSGTSAVATTSALATTSSATTTTSAVAPTLQDSLLQQRDLPAGWVATPHSGDDTRNACYADLPQPTSKVSSDDFSRGDFTASSSSAVFADEAQARTFVERAQDASVLTCLRADLQRTMTAVAAGAAVTTTLVALPTVAYGDASTAMRATVTLTEAPGATTRYVIDTLLVRVGRAGFFLVLSGPVAALDTASADPIALVLLARLRLVPLPAGTTTTSAVTSTTTPSVPSATSLAAIISFLGAHDVTCTSVDIENEGATAAPVGAYNRAICYRSAGRALELLLYRSAADREQRRPELTTLPCTAAGSLRELDGRSMTVAAGQEFDIRATDSTSLTTASLTVLNAATEELARTTGLRVTSLVLRCA